MELLEHKNFNHFSKPNSFKLVIIKFFASLFFFAVIFSSSSSILPLMFYLVEFLSSNIDKNYMFLLSNGILVLIVKNSGLIRSHQENNHYGDGGGRAQKVVGLSDEKAVDAGEKVEHMKAKEVQEVEDKSLMMAGAGDDHNIAFSTQDKEVQQEYDQIGIFDEEEEEEEEEEAIGLLSAEELNRKCDDFIRRMREGIKSEAQQLIMIEY